MSFESFEIFLSILEVLFVLLRITIRNVGLVSGAMRWEIIVVALFLVSIDCGSDSSAMRLAICHGFTTLLFMLNSSEAFGNAQI